MYIRDLVASITRPVKELKGFQQIVLKAGETKTVSFNITTEDLKNPQKNLEVGVAIMQKWVQQDGCISCTDSAGNHRGVARYWSVMRGDRADVIANEINR